MNPIERMQTILHGGRSFAVFCQPIIYIDYNPVSKHIR